MSSISDDRVARGYGRQACGHLSCLWLVDRGLLAGSDHCGKFYPDKATIIQIDAEPTHIGRRHPVAIGAVGDIKTTLEALLPRLKQHEDSGFLSRHVERHRTDVASAKAETVSGSGAAVSGTYLTRSSISTRPKMRCSRQMTGPRRSGCFVTSTPAGNAEPSPACFRGRWRAGWGRRLDCKSASPAAR